MFAPDGKHEENRARMAKALGLEKLPETGSGTRSAILQAAANRAQANEAQAQPLAMQPEVPTQAADTAQAAQGTGVTQTEAAPQNGEPLVGSPEWMAREKAKQTESKVTAAAQKARRGEHLSRTELDLLTNPNNRQTAQAVLGEELPKGAKEAREYLRGMEGRQNTAVNDDPDTHTPEQMRAIEEYKASVDMDLVEYYKAVSRGEKRPSYTVGTVEGRAAKAIRDMTGVEAQGSSVVMNRNSVEHIQVRHGENGKANSTMADPEDVGRVNYVLQNFDEAYRSLEDARAYKDADGKNSAKVIFTKKIDGTYVVVEAVPDNQSGKVYIVTQYLAMGEPDKTKWGEPWQAALSPSNLEVTSREHHVRNETASSSPTQRVAENEDSVKEEMPDMSWADSYQADREETDQYGRRRVSAKDREQVRKIGAKFRRNVRFEELGPGENGYFDRSTGEIVLSTYMTPGTGAVSVLVHELTHSAELARTYQAIKDFVRESETAKKWLRENGFDSFEQYAAFLGDRYQSQGKDADPEAEAVAFFVQENLFKSEQSLKELESGHRGILQKLLDLVRTALGQLTGRTSEENELRRVERMLEKALKETEGQAGQSQAEGIESRQYSITLGMSEEQRARELKDARITMPLVNNEQFNRVSAELEQERIEKSAAAYAKMLGDKFQIFRGFENPGMEIEFEFSKDGARESANKQIHRGGSTGLQRLHKLFSCFEKVIRGAVPVEIHSDRYKDTYREDKKLKQTYVLLGAYRDGNPDTGELDTVPVLFQIKEFSKGNQANKLYVTVTAKKTGTEGHSARASEVSPRGANATSVPVNSTIAEKARGVKEKQVYCTVEELVQSLNAEDGWMLKYFPDSWLSEAQKQGKQAALEDDAKKLRELEEETRQRQKKQEEEKRVRENESGDQKNRQFDLDLSEDIRRRKEERDQKTRQAVEEMDQAVRAGLQKDAARREELGRKVARDISGCLACEYCHQPGSGHERQCAQKDDMQQLYPALDEADMLVLASPIYYHGFSGQLQCALNRIYALDRPRRLRQAALILSSGDADVYEGAEYEYRRSFLEYLAWKIRASIPFAKPGM